MVGEADDLVVIHETERGIGGKRVRELLVAPRIRGRRQERMHVADDGALFARELRDRRVIREQTGRRGARVTHVIRNQHMTPKTEQALMPPGARVVFLRLDDEHIVARRRIGRGVEVADVRDALLLVDDQVEGEVQVFSPGLPDEVLRGVSIGAAIVHVDVHVP